MKKTLTAAITTALVIGAASTTFAAANPFTDVPAGHWSYDAVAKLAQDGVIEGYGDGTFRGDKAITRYEMAQMVAKAMAKSDVSAADKAAIDKLAAEYSTELNNLGVRVGELENKVDNVKFGGKVRLRLNDQSEDTSRYGKYQGDGANQSYLDLWGTAKINDGWVAKFEVESKHDLNSGHGNEISDNTSKIYAEGTLMGADTKIGKFGVFSQEGFVIDKAVSGVQFTFGNALKTTLTAGNIDSLSGYGDIFNATGDTANYASVMFNYKATDKLDLYAAYHQVANDDFNAYFNNNDKLSVYELGFTTKLGSDWSFQGLYTKADQDVLTDAGVNYETEDTGYLAEFKYKAADTSKVGSYDIFTNYRQVPQTMFAHTNDDYALGNKGWTIGFDYVPAENVNFQAFYFDGKDVDNSDLKTKYTRAQVEFFF